MDNILQLHEDLKNKTYKHGGYQQFKINDPKPRTIHKASVRDRLLHHAVYRIFYPLYDKTFVSDSFSCRNNKGTYKAINRFRKFGYIVSKNNTKTCWILKCDIKKFFASIDQEILINILEQRIFDKNIINLLQEIICSFKLGGLPLGNLTSQLFANVYLNELDQFVKHKLKVKYYIRYADDFVIFIQNNDSLDNLATAKISRRLILKINIFLWEKLKLQMHPDKVFIKRLKSGMDFLGWINFFDYRILRTKTKNRIIKRLNRDYNKEIFNSYLGLLKHGKSCRIKKNILNKYIWQN